MFCMKMYLAGAFLALLVKEKSRTLPHWLGKVGFSCFER